jgi:hypothetical protein
MSAGDMERTVPSVLIWHAYLLTCLSNLCSESDSGESSTSSKEAKEGAGADADMDVEDDEDKPTGPSDPNDLSAYNLDNYDEEVSRGTGEQGDTWERGWSVMED